MARTASTRAISYFAFRCYSEIVANRPAWNRWPIRCFLSASVSFPPRRIPPRPSSSLFAVAARSSRRVLVPVASYPTRCFINENEGASYIFLTRARGVGRLLSLRTSFFPPRISSFRHRCFHSSRRCLSAGREAPVYPAVSSSSLFAVTSPLLAAVILLSVYRTGLWGMRQRALREINSDRYHACLGKPSQNSQKRKRRGKEGKKTNREEGKQEKRTAAF